MCKHCWDAGESEHHKDFIQGAVDPDDGWVEVNYQARPKSKNKKKKTRPGCSGNEYGPHIYVWTTEREFRDFFYDYFGFPKYQHKVCVGCGKTNGSKHSDEYMKVKERKWAKKATPEKGVPVSRWNRRYRSFKWWSWESEDAEYMAARREYIDRNGYPRYLYSNLF